jgi:hypothetical protein
MYRKSVNKQVKFRTKCAISGGDFKFRIISTKLELNEREMGEYGIKDVLFTDRVKV